MHHSEIGGFAVAIQKLFNFPININEAMSSNEAGLATSRQGGGRIWGKKCFEFLGVKMLMKTSGFAGYQMNLL